MATEQHSTQPSLPILRSALCALRSALCALHTVAGAVLAVLLLRVAFGLLALPVSAAFPDTPLEQRVGLIPGNAPLGDWLQRVVVQPWQRYDAWNYERIAAHGYRIEEGTAAFHPLYPLLAASLGSMLGNVQLALLVVSTCASVALCVVFARYVRRFHPEVSANRAGWLLLLAPPSFILLAPYTESLFMALAVGCLWATHARHWWLAGLLGAGATLTRQQGLALFLPMVYALLVEQKAQSAERNVLFSIQHSAFSILLVPFGYALFIAYRAVALGDLGALARPTSPITFLWNLLVSPSSETVVAGQRITWPWVVVADQLRLIVLTGNSYDMLIDLVLGLAMAILVVAGLPQMRVTERLYSLAVLALALCYYNGDLNPYMALPRHLLLAFPLFIALARWLGSGDWGRRALIGLLLANLFLAGAFVRHGWVP